MPPLVTTLQAMRSQMQQLNTMPLSMCSHTWAQGEQHPHTQSEQALSGAGCWLESGVLTGTHFSHLSKVSF